jgi:hypothetical protein
MPTHLDTLTVGTDTGTGGDTDHGYLLVADDLAHVVDALHTLGITDLTAADLFERAGRPFRTNNHVHGSIRHNHHLIDFTTGPTHTTIYLNNTPHTIPHQPTH